MDKTAVKVVKALNSSQKVFPNRTHFWKPKSVKVKDEMQPICQEPLRQLNVFRDQYFWDVRNKIENKDYILFCP